MDKKNGKTSDKVLLFMGISLIVFIIVMVITFWVKFSVPDSLIQGVFGLFLSEAGFLAWIRTAKQKYPGSDDNIYEEE